MSTPFALLEARVNAAAIAKLKNATASIAGVDVEGVFTRGYTESLGVEGYETTFQALTASLPALQHGTLVAGLDASYRVVGIHNDSGLTTLVLERA